MKDPILFNPRLHAHLIPQIVKVHQQCILLPPYTIATFLPPLKIDVMTKYWERKAQDVTDGSRFIVIQMAQNATTEEEEVAGVVMLDMPGSETGPFRGEIGKLLVSPEHRERGIARRLMAKLEDVAVEKGKTMLV
jgi:ribosomal protein S18 acetylase RimI-like enzyme